MPDFTLHHGDCVAGLARVPAESIELCVTSPPYNCGKEYGDHDDAMNLVAYWDFMSSVFSGVSRSLVPSGRFAVNIPWWIGKKPRVFTMESFIDCARRAGLTLIDKIIWIKGSERGLRGDLGTGWGTWLSPSGPSVRCASEPILVFAKGDRGRRKVSGEGRGRCLPGDMTKDEFLAYTTDCWFIQGRSDRERDAVFPHELPRRLIKLYSWPGETVLDPFTGSGTTGEACMEIGRNFVGMELDAEGHAIAHRRISEAKFAADSKLFAVAG